MHGLPSLADQIRIQDLAGSQKFLVTGKQEILAARLASARLAIRRLRLKASLRSRVHGSELSSARLRVVRLASTRLTTPRLASSRYATHRVLNLEDHGKAASLLIPLSNYSSCLIVAR